MAAVVAAEIKKKNSRSAKAGLKFNVARNTKALRRAKVADKVNDKAPLYITGALEAICKHILAKTWEDADDRKERKVDNTNVIAAVRQDPALARFFGGFAFSSVAVANKAIDHILPEKEQRDRQKRIQDSKAKAKERLEEERAKRAEQKAEKAKAAGGGGDGSIDV